MKMTTAKDTVWEMTPHPAMAKQLAVRDLPALVCDAVNLEGVAMTLPEVQMLLDGITVGGYKISDQNMTLNQADAWKHLFQLVSENNFSFSKTSLFQKLLFFKNFSFSKTSLFQKLLFFKRSGLGYPQNCRKRGNL